MLFAFDASMLRRGTDECIGQSLVVALVADVSHTTKVTLTVY